jgi:RNA polymerase sigma-B factor
VDRAPRDRQIEELLPLVHALAHRYAGLGEPLEDLVQAGTIGLIKAVDRFDRDRGAPLAAYAIPLILGEMRHHLRDLSAAVRIPRSVRRPRFEPLDEDALAAGDALGPAETLIVLVRAARALPEPQCRVLAMRYFGDLTQAEIADRLGISAVQTSRLLHRALDTLRAEIGEGLAAERRAA